VPPLQIIDGQTFTEDGLEETFAVNHLALVDALLSRDRSLRRVVLVGSATHDPAVRTGPPPFGLAGHHAGPAGPRHRVGTN
jgi:hypothetical protein